ncbi:MAG: hypothetical protein HGA49_05560, partial [Eubacteriaceae bacterium]|nr:hypothetical protein [Eubacteriaceae bacterium]
MRRFQSIHFLMVIVLVFLLTTGCASSSDTPENTPVTPSSPPIVELVIKEQNHTISAGYKHTLGLKTDGTVVAAGNNEN